MDDQTASELRLRLLELSAACPFHADNPQDCPLFPLRNLRPRARQSYMKALPKDELEYLAAYHKVCLHIREASGVGN